MIHQVNLSETWTVDKTFCGEAFRERIFLTFLKFRIQNVQKFKKKISFKRDYNDFS